MEEHAASLIKDFFSHYASKRFKKGQILIYGGDEPGGVYLLIKGTVKQYDINNRGDEVVVNVFKPPAFFPMSWAISKRHNPYFFEADMDIEVRIAPADDVLAFLKQHPAVTFDLLRRLYSGTDGLQRRMAHLMGGSARTRLIFELVTESKRFGKRKADGSIYLTLTESALAERTGLTRETISREVRKLRDAELLGPGMRPIVVRNLKALENILGDTL